VTSVANRHPEAAVLYRLASYLYAVARSLRIAATRLDIWLEARRRAEAARRDLSQMTDGELRDIGLSRSDIEWVARGISPRAADG